MELLHLRELLRYPTIKMEEMRAGSSSIIMRKQLNSHDSSRERDSYTDGAFIWCWRIVVDYYGEARRGEE